MVKVIRSIKQHHNSDCYRSSHMLQTICLIYNTLCWMSKVCLLSSCRKITKLDSVSGFSVSVLALQLTHCFLPCVNSAKWRAVIHMCLSVRLSVKLWYNIYMYKTRPSIMQFIPNIVQRLQFSVM